MSFGRLTAAAFAGTVETTVALASLNFDFSLVKVEAPSEYKEFGTQLSAQRSEEAENGQIHVTARKLGALFADVIPACPKLIAAYGVRVCEIAKSTSHNPRGSWRDGMFAEQIGADGTSIWAAATSGSSAIAVHLLACMLARTWPAPKAISIWIELILERKKALMGPGHESTMSLLSLTTAQISISREQVAKWDSSARGWLQTADTAKALTQSQLMLIVNNISIPVNDKIELYTSVLSAWSTAMTSIEGIVSGVSQSFHTGASLLGLCSWHLFPDILVLGDCNKDIKQNDPLIPQGTIATLGLQTRDDPNSANTGIFWSLPLAHLRFYGDPIQTVGSVERESGLNADQLMQVALGSFVGQWAQNFAEFSSAFQALVLISNFLPRQDIFSFTWLRVLADAAKAYLTSTGFQRDEYSRLLKSGRRRYPHFLAEKKHWTRPLLGLTSPDSLLALSSTVEDRIRILRNVALRFGENGHRMAIRYHAQRFHSDGHFELATVLPIEIPRRGTKRRRGGVENSAKVHIRWIESSDRRTDDSTSEAIRDLGEEVIKLTIGSIWSPMFGTRLEWKNAPQPFSQEEPDPRSPRDIVTPFRFILGDANVAALYAFEHIELPPIDALTLDEVQRAFVQKRISADKLSKYVEDLEQTKEAQEGFPKNLDCAPTIQSLKALGLIAEVYKDLRDARIAIKVAERPLHKAKWIANLLQKYARRIEPFQYSLLSYAQTFACIASLESGSIDIDPNSLEHVMAMSTGSSIYIAAPLISDPANYFYEGKVRRVVGNVGRPGLAMLTSPRNPKMRSLDHDTWNHINHNDFDGKFEDSFQHTTLHLSFTDWEMPIDIGAHGSRDREVFFLEAPISVHHRGDWIADIDILSMISSRRLIRRYLPTCEGHAGKPVDDTNREIIAQQLVAIDSWDELLDIPLEAAVVRAHRNWQARLAATALSVQRGHTTIVMPVSFCWNCYLGRIGRSRYDEYGCDKPQEVRQSFESCEREEDRAAHLAAGRISGNGNGDESANAQQRSEGTIPITNLVYIM